jgi:hypothetical protein
MPTHPLLPGAVAITLGANPRPELTAHRAHRTGVLPTASRASHGSNFSKRSASGGRPLTRS